MAHRIENEVDTIIYKKMIFYIISEQEKNNFRNEDNMTGYNERIRSLIVFNIVIYIKHCHLYLKFMLQQHV